MNSGDIVGSGIANCKTFGVVDTMTKAEVWMDVFVEAFGVREESGIPFFVFVGCRSSVLGDSIAEVLFARWAKVTESEVFTIDGNEAIS